MQFLIALAVAAMIGLAACIFTFIITGTTYWWRRSWQQVIADLHHSRSGDTAIAGFINRYRWLLVGAVAIISALAVIVAAGRGGAVSRPTAITFGDVPTSAPQNPGQGQDYQVGSQTPSPGHTYPYHDGHAHQGDRGGRYWWGEGNWREQKPTPAPTPTTHTSTPGLITPTPAPTTPTSAPSGTYAWTSTGQFATYSADGFKWNNDAWGSGAGSQTIEINSPSDWSVVSNQAYQLYQVQTYPDIFVNPNEPVSYYRAITSTASEQSPSGPGEYNEAAYNIWLNGTAGTNAGGDGSTSVMIWTDCHNVSVNNEGTYTIGGTKYYFNKSLVQPGNFYQWTFVQLTNTSTQTTNILAVLDWIAAHGGPSSPTLTAIDFGWEIWGTEGTQKFHVSSYSLTMTP
jgi:hypothetical protein